MDFTTDASALSVEPQRRRRETWDPVPASQFRLDREFLKQYIYTRPDFGPLGEITYKRTYARSLEAVSPEYQQLAAQYKVKDSEDWWLTLVRVVEGTYRIQERHCNQLQLPWRAGKAQRSAQEMYRLMWHMKFLPPGRGLWIMGTNVVDRLGCTGLLNCAFVSTEDIEQNFASPFVFLMDMSMLGVGVGIDTRGAGAVTIKRPIIGPPEVVDDSREGWLALIRRLLDSYVGCGTKPSTVDYSRIRPAGAPIRGFGGTSSGAGPLIELVSNLSKILDRRVNQKITSEDIVDIANYEGRCVVAGNIRRSAEATFGAPTDEAFLQLKDPTINAEALDSHRWASNNSIFTTVGQDYTRVAKLTALNGEPGYLWLDNARRFGRMGHPPDDNDLGVMGANPCMEQVLESYELCCLAETFPSRHESYDEFQRTLKFAYLYAKTVTLVPTHDVRSNAIMLRNRRIGTSMSGIVEAMQRHGRREFFNWCDRGYTYLRQLDNTYSRWLCVPKSVKITTVKPSGSVSLLPQVTPGIHFPHSQFYFRVIRFASDSPLVERLREANYRCVDLSPDEPNTTAVYFAVEEKHFNRAKRDVTMWEQLEIAASMQQHWSDNAVSVTVTFQPHEAKDIQNALELYETRLKAVSFLPLREHGYNHAPYQEIDEATYEAYIAQLGPLKLTASTNERLDSFCDSDRCEVRR